MSFGERKTESSVEKDTLRPKWKEGPLELGPLDVNGSGKLKIELYDKDTVTYDDFMGSVSLSERQLWVAAEGDGKVWFKVVAPKGDERNAGHIQLDVAWSS